MYYFPLTLEGAIMRKLLMMVVVVSALMVSAAGAQTASKVDPRLVGGWWNGVEGDRGCSWYNFAKDGTGSESGWCGPGVSFNFTIVNNRIKFHNAQNCDESGCDDIKMNDLEFSFSDDGKTLILGKNRYKKMEEGESGGCCL
jgi:hypothetical protein